MQSLSVTQMQPDKSEITELEDSVMTQKPEPIDWENTPEPEKIDAIVQHLKGWYPEEDLKELENTLKEAKNSLVPETSNASVNENPDQQREINKQKYSVQNLAGVGMLFILDSALNQGRGTNALLERIIHEQVFPAFLKKLGMDEEMIGSLFSRGNELGRGLLQMDKPSVLRFLGLMSKHETYNFLRSLDDDERQQFINDGSVGDRAHLLTSDEVQKYVLDRLTDQQKVELKISS